MISRLLKVTLGLLVGIAISYLLGISVFPESSERCSNGAEPICDFLIPVIIGFFTFTLLLTLISIIVIPLLFFITESVCYIKDIKMEFDDRRVHTTIITTKTIKK